MWTFDWWYGSGCESRREPFSPPLLSLVGWGFVAERRPARLRFAFLPCGARVSWVSRLVGRLALRAVAPHFSHAVCYLVLLLPVVACAPDSLCGVLRGCRGVGVRVGSFAA